MFARFQTHGCLRNPPIEVHKKGVGATAGRRHVRYPYWVVECFGTVTCIPEEGRSCKLIPRHILCIAWFNDLFHDSSYPKLVEKLADNRFGFRKREPSEIREGSTPAEEWAESTASRKIEICTIFVVVTRLTREKNGSVF